MNVSFIGCGGFTSGNHIPNVAGNPNFKMRGFCDLDEGRLEELQRKYRPAYVTTDMRKVFDDPETEMVICGTKPDFRLPIMELAVAKGKHLFVEKPLCYRRADIVPMVRLMKGAPVKFMVGFNRPYSPIMQDVKTWYNKIKSGSVTIIYRIVGEGLLWPKHHWDAVMVRKESTIIHEVTHIINLLCWLTDSLPLRVYTAGEGNTDNVITLEYPERVTAVIIAGDNSTAGFPKERLEINTGYSTILGDNFTELSVYAADGTFFRKRYGYTVGDVPKECDAVAAAEELWNWRISVTEAEKKVGYYYQRMPKVDKGHKAELEFFREAILKDRQPDTGVIDGAVAQIVAERAVLSWERHEALNIDFSEVLSL